MNTPSFDTHIQQAADLVRDARQVVVLTGAGISTPSGIPDFRSKNTGLWEKIDPMQAASLSAFRSKPALFYTWLRPLLRQIWAATPNPAHIALAQLEKAGKIRSVITQNIDGLHQRAGSQLVIEVHGTLNTMTCQRCLKQFNTLDFQSALLDEECIPVCPNCQGTLKPDVVLFEETLPQDAWAAAESECSSADVLLVIGSSLTVWPVAGLPNMAILNQARLMINNLTPTPMDLYADLLLPFSVDIALPKLVEQVL